MKPVHKTQLLLNIDDILKQHSKFSDLLESIADEIDDNNKLDDYSEDRAIYEWFDDMHGELIFCESDKLDNLKASHSDAEIGLVLHQFLYDLYEAVSATQHEASVIDAHDAEVSDLVSSDALADLRKVPQHWQLYLEAIHQLEDTLVLIQSGNERAMVDELENALDELRALIKDHQEPEIVEWSNDVVDEHFIVEELETDLMPKNAVDSTPPPRCPSSVSIDGATETPRECMSPPKLALAISPIAIASKDTALPPRFTPMAAPTQLVM